MKLRKFLTILAVIAVLMTVMAISASAVEFVVSMDQIESIEKTVSGYDCWGNDEAMFDGNTNSAGSWYTGNGFALPQGQSATINFIEEFEVLSVIFYGWSNWSDFSVVFYDAEGNEVLRKEMIGWQDTEGRAHDLSISGIRAKSMVITTLASKGLRNHTYTEFVITGNHEHKFDTFEDVIVLPTCTIDGVVTYSCVCGEIEERIDPATGDHTDPFEMVIFRNGLNNPGYLADVCMTCDTQDVIKQHIGPLFKALGYSASTFGPRGITFGFEVNYENIALYEELTGTTVEFGIVAGSRNAFPEESGNPVLIGAEGLESASNKIVVKDMSSYGFKTVTYKIVGFDESHDDDQFILAGYIYDTLSIYYLGETTTYGVITKSYNELVAE